MSIVLTAIAMTPFLCAVDPPEFEAPVQVTTAGRPFDKMIYPTPVLYDADGDGERELVIGDLAGRFWLCQREDSADDTAWTKAEQFQADGKPLRLNNW